MPYTDQEIAEVGKDLAEDEYFELWQLMKDAEKLKAFYKNTIEARKLIQDLKEDLALAAITPIRHI